MPMKKLIKDNCEMGQKLKNKAVEEQFAYMMKAKNEKI